jgi:hypothetical protein
LNRFIRALKKNCPGESREQSQNSKVKSQKGRQAGLQLSAFAPYATLREKKASHSSSFLIFESIHTRVKKEFPRRKP